MKEDTLELAENKLLLLYIINEIKLPISNLQLTEIVLENNFLNYFNLQQYLLELNSSGFIKSIEKDEKIRLCITDKGEKVLTMFFSRISEDKVDKVSLYLDKHMENIKKQITITSDYTIEGKDNFIVTLGAYENESILIEVKLSVPNNKQARDLCTKWKENSAQLYDNVIKTLISDV
ncbi:DUF4364 family protein [Hathewaya massiliensis]|uniref:DUF4364 family protein n=1 Tax=Hathewaya massiliensis TaxID=1964382 RepID=UPI0011599D27|nr:DUF4364 family protein [Hathewaya massiliensis]